MQAARDGVAAATELAAGVQRREHDLDRRLGQFGRVPRSTGMPRPRSITRMPPSGRIVTSTRSL